jgi:cytochrome c biogenesis protein CcmG/thiol:disulfide interchange protein DsbE
MSVITSRVLLAGTLRLGVAVLLAVLAPQARAASSPGEGMPAPALAGRSFSGEAFDLDNWRGKVVVLNFWASWCGPCRSEMPLLDALQHDYRERGVVVLGLSADDRHDRKDALAASQGVAYLTGMLTDCSSNGFGAPQMLPLTYIIDRRGTLSAVLRANRGALSAGELRAAVDHALGDAVPAAVN